MNKQLILCFLMPVLIIAGCSKEIELQKSVFQPDEELADLPAYSEWGYNTFGAYYDRSVFISDNQQIPVKVISTDGKMSFRLHGHLEQYADYYSDHKDMKVTFVLDGFSPGSYSDMLQLHERIFDLQSPEISVVITIDETEIIANIINGAIQFKRAQMLFVDREPAEVILSGYFDFQALVNDEPVTFSNGRFDLGIGVSNFFTY